MAKLTAKKRNDLSSKQFVLPSQRKYPIPDKSHARNALSRVSEFGSPELKSEVRAKVSKKFPGISLKMDGGQVCQRADKAKRRK